MAERLRFTIPAVVNVEITTKNPVGGRCFLYKRPLTSMEDDIIIFQQHIR